jgi:hypothetical protein
MTLSVVVEIDPLTLEVTYEVEGAIGTKCTDITSVLASGKKVVKEELKNSYYELSESPDFVENLG